MARLPVRSVRHLPRYREIVGVFNRHGFSPLVDLLGLRPYLPMPPRFLRRWRRERPEVGPPAHLRLALEELGPTFVKLGQVLSTRPDLLPPAYVTELAKLQDTVPAADWEPVKAQIEGELGGSVDQIFATIDPLPIAAASLAQVHAATLLDGSKVVVKVQRPSVQKTVETDLDILHDLAALLDERTPLSEIYNLPEIIDEFSATLRSELDFYREGRNADRFRESFREESYLYIPQVYWDQTTRRVLVLERIEGIKIDNVDALDAAGYDRSRIAVRAAKMVIREVLEDGFFHADPHPGNFVIMPDEVIGAMDFGMVGTLSRQTRADLVRLYVVAIQMDEEAIVDQLIRLGAVTGVVDRAGLRRDIGRLLRKYYGMPLRAIRASEVIEEVMPVAFRHHIHLPSELWLLGKTMAMMEGVGLKLDPGFDIFAFSEPYVKRYIWRMVAPKNWGTSLFKGAADWSDLVGLLPRVGYQVLSQVERGEYELVLRHQGLDRILARVDRSANRLALSMLLAAMIVGLSLLISVLEVSGQWGMVVLLIVLALGLAAAALLAVWLILSIVSSAFKR